MAIGIESSQINSSAAGSTTISINGGGPAFTITAGTLLAVFAGWANSSVSVTSITDVTVAGSSIKASALFTALTDTNFMACGAYYLKSPASGTPTITVTFSPGQSLVSIVAASFTGVDTTSTFGTPGNNFSTANKNATVSSSSSAGEWVLGFVASDAGTIAEGGTLIKEVEGLGADVCFGAQYYTTTSPTVTWTGTGGDNGWCCGQAVIKPSGGATAKLRRNSSLNGLGASGPFFHDPLSVSGRRYSFPQTFARKGDLYVPAHVARGETLERAA
jgi:hypothetical protein